MVAAASTFSGATTFTARLFKIAHNLSSWSKLVRSSIDQPVTRSNSLQMA